MSNSEQRYGQIIERLCKSQTGMTVFCPACQRMLTHSSSEDWVKNEIANHQREHPNHTVYLGTEAKRQDGKGNCGGSE